ncbi:TadE family protein [Streptomyces aureoverticillatus]|uniref:TadE family protein n=1 Tax=Streptomyces aureoverticillatus TaxID=66871 RepID=UPI0023BB0C8D|nr:TadE family protein [Streptomyces aureoverticillatus]
MPRRIPQIAAWVRSRPWREDRGDASIQMAIIYPFVLLLAVAVIQASMWYYAREIALTAAREGLSEARSYKAGPGDGIQRAREVLDRTAGDSLLNSSVSTAGSTGQRIRIQVSGTAQSMLPGVPGLRIAQSASGTVERWTVPGE